MLWFQALKRTAARPPAYLVERISDLHHACDLAPTSPREANQVISSIISDLTDHHDDAYVVPLKEASRIMLDSPNRAIDAIHKVVEAMEMEKSIYESERDTESWTSKI